MPLTYRKSHEWNVTAERVFAEAEAQPVAGHRVSARDNYLRAATYFRASEFFLHGNHEDPRIYSAYKKSIDAYKLCCGPIHRERLPFRTDWEKVVTPVIDFALTLPGVDPEKIALMGISMGGVLAPRAAAFEKRISALVANDGICDFGVTQLASIPPDQRESFIAAVNQKEAPELDHRIAESMKSSPISKWAGEQAGFVMGESTPHGVVAKMLRFNLRGGIAEQISCPTLVLDADEDMFLKGQPDELYEHLNCPKTMIRFTTAEGAGAHCQVGADRLAAARIFDWLDKTFGRAGRGYYKAA